MPLGSTAGKPMGKKYASFGNTSTFLGQRRFLKYFMFT
jgi:hypothetical protein